MNMNFKVNFNFSENIINPLGKRAVTSEFVDLREEAIKVLNPRYKEWNEEFDASGKDQSEYERWICNKMIKALRDVGILDKGEYVNLAISTECDIIAITRKTRFVKEGIKVWITLTEA